MDKYTEDAEAMREYYYNEMMIAKANILIKLKSVCKQDGFLEKLAELIVYANAEDVKQASEIIEILDMDNLDQLAILEDLDCFANEFKELKENTYARDNYEQ